METVILAEATLSPFPEMYLIAQFYDRAFLAALGSPAAHDGRLEAFYRCVDRAGAGGTFTAGPVASDPVRLAYRIAQDATERRFGVKLVLPGDGE